ncbi:hypothetical protein [Dysgonomonas sp. 37-18]|uniref:hypothetical protein n=1 Tax=Dysgonomonas sp. 37-18 TaxID=1895907 RepID=UPI0025BE6A6C|nr:hypothetical protein [Dysgonomonas sp. 37-18]
MTTEDKINLYLLFKYIGINNRIDSNITPVEDIDKNTEIIAKIEPIIFFFCDKKYLKQKKQKAANVPLALGCTKIPGSLPDKPKAFKPHIGGINIISNICAVMCNNNNANNIFVVFSNKS